MAHPFLENTVKAFQYTLLWIAYAFLQTLVLGWILLLPFWVIVSYGFIQATLFGGLGIMLWSVVKYGKYSSLPAYQRFINYTSLALLTIAIWLGGGYGLIYLIFGENTASLLVPILPVLGLIGLLLYLLIIQYFNFVLCRTEQTEQVSEITQEDKIPEVTKPVIPEDKEILERVAVKSGSKIHVVLVSEILYLQADGDYVDIFTANGKFLKEQTMKYFEEHLPANQFVRVHRSVIVNVEMISRIELYEKQNQLLTLKNGQQIKTSPGGYKALRLALNL